MKRILLVSHSQKLGGAEKCLIELAAGLAKAGWEVYVVVPSRGENFASFAAIAREVIISPYAWWVHGREGWKKTRLLRKTLSQLRSASRLAGIIKRVQPAAVLSNTVTIPAAAIAARWCKVRHFWFIHELATEDHQLYFDYGLQRSCRIIARYSEKVFVNSAFVRQKFQQFIPEDQLAIVSYGVEEPVLATGQQPSGHRPNLYMIGQISRAKGQLDAIQAHQQLLSKGMPSALHIIGQKSDRVYFEEITHYIREHQIPGIHFIDHCTQPFALIKDNAVGLVCSRNEAFGRITIEYMMAGVPVVGADAGNTPSLIDDGHNGLLYDPGNASMLAEKIALLITGQIVEKLTAQARSYAQQHFNAAQYSNTVLSFIEK